MGKWRMKNEVYKTYWRGHCIILPFFRLTLNQVPMQSSYSTPGPDRSNTNHLDELISTVTIVSPSSGRIPTIPRSARVVELAAATIHLNIQETHLQGTGVFCVTWTSFNLRMELATTFI
jgi:hypothetical protein